MIDISIIIPTYNRLWSLPETIASCRNTKCNTEIIVIDDGSTDGTWEWLQSQNGITILKQENWGKCWAVNKGFEVAQGKYIRFLDSDDLLNHHANDEQFTLGEIENADVVVSGYKLITDRKKILKQQPWIISDDFIAQQLGESDSSHYSSYLFKRHFISSIPHRPDYAFRDDRLFVLEVACKKPRISIHKGCALLHRQHEKDRLQRTNNLDYVIQNYQHFKIYQKILSKLALSNELNERRINASTRFLWPLSKWVAKDSIKNAIYIFEWIKELNPSFKIDDKGVNGKMYRLFGFKITSHLLNLRRLIINS